MNKCQVVLFKVSTNLLTGIPPFIVCSFSENIFTIKRGTMKILYYSLALLCVAPALHARKHDLHCNVEKQKLNASRFACSDERKAAMDRRMACSCMRTMLEKNHSLASEQNGDEKRVPYYAAQFSKGLEHDAATGFLTEQGQKNYETLVAALSTGSQETFNSIERASEALMKLVNPQASAAFSLVGTDSSLIPLESFPCLSSKKAAALLIENYLLALCRDVFFEDYGTGKRTDADGKGGSLTKKAAAILQDLGKSYQGPRNKKCKVDPSVLFRGNNTGALVGPYVSQFLCQPLNIPVSTFPAALLVENIQDKFAVEQLHPVASKRNFGITMSDFVAVENGLIPQSYQSDDYSSSMRYIASGRDLATIVHWDNPCQAGYNALLVLFAHRFPFSATCPYVNGTIKNEGALVTMGFFDVFGMVGDVSTVASKHAWAHKWRAQRALRPEAFAGIVHTSKTTDTNPCNLNHLLFEKHAGIDLLEWVREANEAQGASTYLLSQAYPEGSPLHPSYPAGHATIAGACITVIKAIFDDRTLISSYITPVKADPKKPSRLIPLNGEGEADMTVGSELAKLASNVSMGRNFAGIHYRADADLSMKLGEKVGIAYLQDMAACYTEETFTGFELTKIDGTRIRITATEVIELENPA